MKNRELALDMATWAHGEQKRKYSGELYIVHCIAVAESVANFTKDEDLICAALLHDTLEDTDLDSAEIEKAFGVKTLNYVKELTDKYTHENYPQLNRKERKILEAMRLKDISKGAKLVKYFDIMDNSSTIFKYDPGFSKVYLKEKQFIMTFSLSDLEL